MYFHNFVIISQCKKVWPSGSGEDEFSNLLMYFCNCVITSPLKRLGPSFEQTSIPFTQGYFVPGLVIIGPVVLKKNFKFVKF